MKRPSYLYLPILIVAYFYNILWALDVLANALIGGSRLTISADCWNAHINGKVVGNISHRIIDGFFRLMGEKNHCRRAWEMNGVKRINSPKRMAQRWMQKRHFIYPGRI